MSKWKHGPLLLALVHGQAMADWVRIASDDKTVFYLDSAISRKVDSHVMVRVLREHSGYQYDRAKPYLSSRDELEVDCAGRRVRRSYSSDHALSMGAGSPVHFEYGPMSWNYAPENTILKRIVGIACAHP